ncbi:MAG: epoxyqueuosine reductase QueH, partial [Ruminococcus sp.]
MSRNYQKEMDGLIAENQSKNRVPTLLLHACCAPCSSYVLEYLSEYFIIKVLYYNPNISPESEYEYRLQEEQRLIDTLNTKNKV